MREELPEAVCVLIRKGDLILCVERKNGDGWGLPGGKVDSTDSSPRKAAERELLEETRLWSDDFFEVFAAPCFGEVNYWVTTFIATNPIQLTDPGKNEGRVSILTEEELLASPTFRAYNTQLFEVLRAKTS